MAVAPFPGRVQGPVERLAFNQRSGEVLSRRVIEAAIARSPHPTFATASFQRAARLGLRRPRGVHRGSAPAAPGSAAVSEAAASRRDLRADRSGADAVPSDRPRCAGLPHHAGDRRSDLFRPDHDRHRAVLGVARWRAAGVHRLVSESPPGLHPDGEHADDAETARAADVADSRFGRVRRRARCVRLREGRQSRRGGTSCWRRRRHLRQSERPRVEHGDLPADRSDCGDVAVATTMAAHRCRGASSR